MRHLEKLLEPPVFQLNEFDQPTKATYLQTESRFQEDQMQMQTNISMIHEQI